MIGKDTSLLSRRLVIEYTGVRVCQISWPNDSALSHKKRKMNQIDLN